MVEIPMNDLGVRGGHHSPRNYDDTLYKVIITRAVTRNASLPIENLLTNVHTREMVAEVWVDLSEQRIIQILDVPEDIMFDGIPVAIF